MGRVNSYNIQGKVFRLTITEEVMIPSPYSIFLANNVPPLPHQQVADVGSGTGIQGVVALAQGARHVFFIDTDPAALELSEINVLQNGFGRTDYTLVEGNGLRSLPAHVKLETLLSNPASLPMPAAGEKTAAYFAGPDGRVMIENILKNLRSALSSNGQLLLLHTSLGNITKTFRFAEELNYQVRIIAQRRLPFRSFYNRAHFDDLGGIEKGLYILEGQESYEILYLLRISRKLNPDIRNPRDSTGSA